MKKRLIFVCLTAIILAAGCGKNDASKETANSANAQAGEEAAKAPETTGIANPWIDCDRETILNKLGFDMAAPEGSSNISYQMNESSGIGQMEFTYGSPALEFTYRMKSVVAYEDISGMNYNWDVSDDITVSWCEGKAMRAHDGEKTVDVCLWCDMAPGVMYSLSTIADDLDGFDIIAVAEAIFVPTQGDADGE